MADYRIKEHPILPAAADAEISFTWKSQPLRARRNETIASALFANGVRTFGHHVKDGAPMGIYCANGQCAQCSVIANGLSVKSCMVRVEDGMKVEPLDGRASLPVPAGAPQFKDIETVETECLILGGGPAGLSAAVELGRAGVNVILIDDKHALGGKLVLQTHKFFGSIDACHAGTRGLDIGKRLEDELRTFESVKIWTETTALSVFSDRKVGVLRAGRYVLVHPHMLLVATGARERSLVFRGNSLPGVYGAGAFQTLVNRDLVRPTERLFVIGGGNVGLIAAYHALQAGIQVVGLCEALPECGGYKVHADKLVRMGVPIYTSHTVVSANGKSEVEGVTIGKLDAGWKVVPGTEKTFQCDTVLVAVGLEPVDEFLKKAKEYGLPVFAAGDAEEIAEASAAMFTGRIRGLEIAKKLGRDVGEVPPEWHHTAEVLKSRPGAVITEEIPEENVGVFPVFHCSQEIPCNPCTSVCANHSIRIEGDDILGLPTFIPENGCDACTKCVAICPGLAMTLVDFRPSTRSGQAEADGTAAVTVPFEFNQSTLKAGDTVTVLDTLGVVLGNVKVERITAPKFADHAALVKVRAPAEIAKRIAGIRVQQPWVTQPLEQWAARVADDEIVCRCERVTAGQLRALIRGGARDMNQLKAATRCGMGACGGKTCPSLIKRIFREEGVALPQVTDLTQRPVFMEVPLGAFAGVVGAADEKQGEAAAPTKPGAFQGGL
ncbi:MAG TPA: FAD-dependent oxidoreductase [Myxococcales bacterium]|jgi:thioredoxin reductase/Fe-S-cluster-containing hydrogenase component 2/bacterioferritin-associated ferredoxin